MLLKNKYLAKMVIEQITEFKLSGPGPLSRYIRTPTTGYFHDKTKIF